MPRKLPEGWPDGKDPQEWATHKDSGLEALLSGELGEELRSLVTASVDSATESARRHYQGLGKLEALFEDCRFLDPFSSDRRIIGISVETEGYGYNPRGAPFASAEDWEEAIECYLYAGKVSPEVSPWFNGAFLSITHVDKKESEGEKVVTTLEVKGDRVIFEQNGGYKIYYKDPERNDREVTSPLNFPRDIVVDSRFVTDFVARLVSFSFDEDSTS